MRAAGVLLWVGGWVAGLTFCTWLRNREGFKTKDAQLQEWLVGIRHQIIVLGGIGTFVLTIGGILTAVTQ